MIEHFFTAPFLFLYFIVPRLRHQRGGRALRARRLWLPDGGRLCRKVVKEKVQRMVVAPYGRNIKLALRDLLLCLQ